MAKQFKKVKRGEDIKNAQIVVQQINQTNVDRTPKEVADWRNAHRIAESKTHPNRSRLLDLYSDVSLDGFLTGTWTKRSAAVTNKEIKFTNAKGEEVEELNELFESKAWEELLNEIMDSRLWGLGGVEFIPGKKFKFEKLPKKHILIEKQLIKMNQNDQQGIDYATHPNILVFGDADDLGIMLKVSYYALIKKGNFSDWAQYSEIFGQPIRVAYYDAYDDKTRMQLKEVLDSSGSSLALMIPKQAEFNIMDGKTSNGNGELQEKLKDACNMEISIIVLGNTETTSNSAGGSEAKAKVQKEGENEILKKDMKYLLSYLNCEKFIQVLSDYGYPVEGGKFEIHLESDPDITMVNLEIIEKTRNIGTPVSDDYVYETTGIPRPEDYEDIKEEMKQRNAFNPYQGYDFSRDWEKEREEDEAMEDLKDSVWNRLRLKLADFFDQAQA